jgi:hypothetical protein
VAVKKSKTEQKRGERCACADDLNFGEPQPDCGRCGGTGTVKEPNRSVGPTFNFSGKDRDR